MAAMAPNMEATPLATIAFAIDELIKAPELPTEVLRSTAGTAALPGFLCGIADERVRANLKQIHAATERPWTVETLAREAALSRSAFFERFQRVAGMPAMEYLSSWRMAVAKDLLRHGKESIAVLAERTGYISGKTFSTAFKRHAGETPARYSRGDGYASAS